MHTYSSDLLTSLRPSNLLILQVPSWLSCQGFSEDPPLNVLEIRFQEADPSNTFNVKGWGVENTELSKKNAARCVRGSRSWTGVRCGLGGGKVCDKVWQGVPEGSHS